MRLAAVPDAPAEARSFVRAVLSHHPRIDDALLSVSELVTNAVRHGPMGDALLIVIDRRDSVIRVSVEQQRGTLGFDRAARRKGSGGLGLSIVEKVTDAWGIDSETGVWFELRE
jgi:anti-sigma regulatory factor (Ser/Thr protein kinase)